MDESAAAIFIREALPDDIPALTAFSRRTFYEAFAAENREEDMQAYLSTHLQPEQLRRELTEPGSHFFLAYSGEELLGYARVAEPPPPSGLAGLPAMEINRLYVDQYRQSHGLGKLLMDHCLQHARSAGMKTVWLGVWEHNKRAIAFYERLGFTRFGQHEFVLGSDVQTDWLMSCEL